ncbi:hypothetical protein H5410_013449 [Solanum commersonii]|uniref:Cullin N-terminal domain-containing protein n=1 Tax=Solanum commersonii TaxID=4109 RepID=A0A9J6AVS7_SOLCO|nr:hypothetical protein H5410_013449 [Solanum commersonii]
MSIDDLLADIKITMIQHSTIDLEHGWHFMQRSITKLKNIREGPPEPQFSSEDYMKLTIYNMCTQKPPHDYSQQLYDKYREAFEEYITTTGKGSCSFHSHFTLIFVRKVIELHDKYLAYVNNCFQNRTLFHKGKSKLLISAPSTFTELLATFCDKILKKCGSEKLSDEAIEETLEKVNSCSIDPLPFFSSRASAFSSYYWSRRKLILDLTCSSFFSVMLQVYDFLFFFQEKASPAVVI